ncbi:MAG: hypothetical protein U0P81_06500 [Holophagaceae bacterium]
MVWTPSAGQVDGYELEGKVNQDGFQKLHNGLIPSTYNSVIISYTSSIGDLTPLEFRIRAARGIYFSEYSNTAKYSIPLRPPAGLRITIDDSAGGVQLLWDKVSTAAEGYTVERCRSDALGNPISQWERIIEHPSGYDTNFLDTSVQELDQVLYRVSNTSGRFVSAPSNAVLIAVPPFRPYDFAAQVQAGEVDFTWKTNSKLTQTFRLIRGVGPYNTNPSGEQIAILPEGAKAYVESNVPVGYYYYTLIPQGLPVVRASDSILVTVKNTIEAINYSKESIIVPPGYFVEDASYSNLSGWVVGTFPPIGSLPTNLSFPAYLPPGRTGTPIRFLAADATGQTHLVSFYKSSPTATLNSIYHDWFNGTQWSSESFGARDLPTLSLYEPVAFAASGSGRPNFMVENRNISSTVDHRLSQLEYIRKSDSGWQIEPLSTAVEDENFERFQFSLDSNSNAHLTTFYGASITAFHRLSLDHWQREQPPLGVTAPRGIAWVDSRWLDAGNGWVFYEAYQADVFSALIDLYVVQKQAGTWLSPVRLCTRPTQSTSGTWADTALSSTTTRPVLMYWSAYGCRVFDQVAGKWRETLLDLEIEQPRFIRTCFDDQARLRFMAKTWSGKFWFAVELP